MEMLSNGYGCIKKCSKTIKHSLFDWILPKFYRLLFKTMSDIPTASTSTASTSSESHASTSRINLNPYSFRSIAVHDIDGSTSEESEISSDGESETTDEESHNSNEAERVYEESDDNMDDASWSTTASSTASCVENTSSDHSEAEHSILKERLSEEKPVTNDEKKHDDPTTPILILVQQPCETEGQMNEIGIDMINVEEHAKRLKELEKELEYIESTEWMYRPIDASIQ